MVVSDLERCREHALVREYAWIISIFQRGKFFQFELSAGGTKQDVGKHPNVPAQNISWPKDPRSAACRVAQDLV